MRSNVSAPALIRQRHGIVEVGNDVSVGDSRWEDGVNFTPRGCNVVFGHDTKCWSPRGDKALQDCPPLAEFYPYVLEATLEWSTVDLGADPKAIITEALDYGTSAVLAALSAGGVMDVTGAITVPPISGTLHSGEVQGRASTEVVDNPHFEDFTTIGAAATDARVAIATVDAKLIDAYDHVAGAGVVYIDPVTAALGRDALCVEPDGHIYTLGSYSKVVIDNVGSGVVYGHIGDVDIYLGAIDVVDITEHGTNGYVAQAERMALAVWNTCAGFKATWAPGP